MKPQKTEITENDSGWLMTYGDMMTLILCFFVLLFSMSTLDPVKMAEMGDAMNQATGQTNEKPVSSLAEIKEELYQIIQQENMEDDATISWDPRGVAIELKGNVSFQEGSVELNQKMENLLDFRQKINKKLLDKNIKVSINDIIIKACSEALQTNPNANAIWAGNKLIKFDSSDIAVAVSVEGGLFTPVIKDTDQKTISNISEEMKDLASRARAKKLMPTEFQGGSFAISNLGMFGIESFDAIINPPHAAILAVGTGKKKPVVSDDGSLGAATEMELSLSVDHRVIDGVLGAQLLHTIVDNLENPIGLLNI